MPTTLLTRARASQRRIPPINSGRLGGAVSRGVDANGPAHPGVDHSAPVADTACDRQVVAAKVGSFPLIRPMLATLGEVPRGDDWAYEMKWDGVRAMVYVEPGDVRVISRNDRDVTGSYPEVTRLGELLPGRRAVIDGEIVSLGADGAPSFGALQQRMHVRTPSASLLDRIPVRLYVFDVPYLDRSTADLRYVQRRELLDDLALDDPLVQTPPYWSDHRGGDEILATAGQLGLEGVVAKRLESQYQPGRRSPAWIKAPLNLTAEVVLGGWKAGAGRRAGMIGSLLLGMHDAAGDLVYVGHVGTGFTQRMLEELHRQLRPLARSRSPFTQPVPREYARDANWVRPDLVGEVVFRSWTPDRRLRHPSWRGIRPDKAPEEVRLPPPP
jgi:bifunctional non-homologous end joining protein LigD